MHTMTMYEEENFVDGVNQLHKDVERIDDIQSSIMDDFSDLLCILLDYGQFSDELKQEISSRFLTPKTTKK